jgi:NADPH:quinone reductase-like Zn-dependent oxidoreductase
MNLVSRDTLRPNIMRRWVLKAGATGLDRLVLEEVPIPEPGPGEVRLKVHAAALNYRDQFVLNGQFGQLLTRDTIPLSDGAGEIDAVGTDVSRWAVGDWVTSVYAFGWVDGPPVPNIPFGLGAKEHDGLLAEYVILPAEQVAAAPTSLSLLEAATLPCAGLTAWTALNGDRPYHDPVAAGDKVLVLGAGGVSLFALLLARARGAEVFATSSQPDKLPRLRALGASDALNYQETPHWGEAIFARTGGMKRVVNAVGSSALEQAIAAVGPGGEIAYMGFFDFSPTPQLVTLIAKGAAVRGTAVGSANAQADLVRFVDAHGIKPPIDQVFTFEEAREAYQAAIAPGLFGKIVIKVAE